jgi:hypothetical protein
MVEKIMNYYSPFLQILTRLKIIRISIIGHATGDEKGNFLVARGSNQLIPLTAQGWDAFLNKE